MQEGRWRGLPAEFGRPDQVAERIAELPTLAERQALMVRIPKAYHGMVQHFAEVSIAERIAALPTKAERVAAFDEVPVSWRSMVHLHTFRLWKVRKLKRAESGDAQAGVI